MSVNVFLTELRELGYSGSFSLLLEERILFMLSCLIVEEFKSGHLSNVWRDENADSNARSGEQFSSDALGRQRAPGLWSFTSVPVAEQGEKGRLLLKSWLCRFPD